ncbi:hypothetical protein CAUPRSCDRAFT_13103, partial [Caulochytrium protostelioides]
AAAAAAGAGAGAGATAPLTGTVDSADATHSTAPPPETEGLGIDVAAVKTTSLSATSAHVISTADSPASAPITEASTVAAASRPRGAVDGSKIEGKALRTPILYRQNSTVPAVPEYERVLLAWGNEVLHAAQSTVLATVAGTSQPLGSDDDPATAVVYPVRTHITNLASDLRDCVLFAVALDYISNGVFPAAPILTLRDWLTRAERVTDNAITLG